MKFSKKETNVTKMAPLALAIIGAIFLLFNSTTARAGTQIECLNAINMVSTDLAGVSITENRKGSVRASLMKKLGDDGATNKHGKPLGALGKVMNCQGEDALDKIWDFDETVTMLDGMGRISDGGITVNKLMTDITIAIMCVQAFDSESCI